MLSESLILVYNPVRPLGASVLRILCHCPLPTAHYPRSRPGDPRCDNGQRQLSPLSVSVTSIIHPSAIHQHSPDHGIINVPGTSALIKGMRKLSREAYKVRAAVSVSPMPDGRLGGLFRQGKGQAESVGVIGACERFHGTYTKRWRWR
jgi:hypothetical protein